MKTIAIKMHYTLVSNFVLTFGSGKYLVTIVQIDGDIYVDEIFYLMWSTNPVLKNRICKSWT